MFLWDKFNRRKVRAHGIEPEEVEQALLNRAIPIHEQDADGEQRWLYYGETDARRLIAVVATDIGDDLRVVTAYPLGTLQKRAYLRRRITGE